METAYMAFANQVIELCGSSHASHTAIALAYIEIELQHHPVRLLSEERKEAAAYIGKALSFVRKMQKFLTTPQVPPLTSNIHSTNITAAKSETPKSLQWTGNTLDLVELIYGLSEMGCIDNGETPLKVLAPALYSSSGLTPRSATATTLPSNCARIPAVPISSTRCRRNSMRRFDGMRNWSG